jgi:glycine cleavage system regulatory protein
MLKMHVYHHFVPDPDVLLRLDALSRKMDLVLSTERRMENTMALDFTKMIDAANKQQGVTNSTLQVLKDLNAKISDLSTQLAAANKANDPVAQAAVQTQLDALATGIQTNDDAIAAAIAAPGTPGTPPPVTP